MKRSLALSLVIAMVLLLAACTGTTTPVASSTTTGASTAASTAPTTTSNEPLYTVKIQYMTMMTMPSDAAIAQVEKAISDYCQTELGLNIALDIIINDLFTMTDTIQMALAGGEKFDILPAFGLNGASVATFVDNGYLTPLDEFLDDELKGAAAVLGDWLACGNVGGVQYAIPCYKGQVLTYKYIYDTKYTDGIGYDMSTVKNLDDIETLYAALKKANPTILIDSNPTAYIALSNIESNTVPIGTYFATLGDSTKLVNYFETESFKRACDIGFRFQKAGYTSPEGSNVTLQADAMVNTGVSIGTLMGHAYTEEAVGHILSLSNDHGATFLAKAIGTTALNTNTLNYGISYTSENPSAAATMLNLLWTDKFVINTIITGVEGVSWEWTDDTKTEIKYLDGLTAQTVPYTTQLNCGAFGNQFIMYPLAESYSADDVVYMKQLIDGAWKVPLFGFIPSSAKVTTQAAAVNNVYNQYYNALIYGDIDPAQYLPEFLQALDDAGIEQIMTEYQTQIDSWLATKG